MKPFVMFAVIAYAAGLSGCQHFRTKCIESAGDDQPQLFTVNEPVGPQSLFGYRFVVTGDFDGDGVADTLAEHYVTDWDCRETNKYCDSKDYGDLVFNAVIKDPVSFLSCSNKSIEDFIVSEGGQLFGISSLHNEGDLDGDGRDEISYVVDVADWSSLNTCHIAKYTNKGWVELASFPIHDWVLPSLPGVNATYGLFGVDGIGNITSDTLNERLEKELKEFSLIKKIRNGVIQAQAMAEEDMDTIAPGENYIATIRLKHL